MISTLTGNAQNIFEASRTGDVETLRNLYNQNKEAIEAVDRRVGFLHRPFQPQLQGVGEIAIDRLQRLDREQMGGGHGQSLVAHQAQQGLEILHYGSGRPLLEVLRFEQANSGWYPFLEHVVYGSQCHRFSNRFAAVRV